MLNFALLGCGRIAKKHAELLSGGHVRGARLAAVCDIVSERAQDFGQCYAVPHFTDMQEMMARHGANIDAVCILTESGNHAEHAVALAAHGKHLVVEKPMALSLADADRMLLACDTAGVKLFVVKQNRFNPPVQKLREAILGGRFGKLFLATTRVRWCRPQAYYDQAAWRGTWAMDGGVLANQASHHIDLLEWMLGEPVSVFAKGLRALADIEAEDTATAIVTFRSGALGIIEATTATRPSDLEGSLSVLGEKGSVEIGGFACNELKTWRFSEPQPGDENMHALVSRDVPNVYGHGHLPYLNDVVEAITTGHPALVDGLEGRKSLELIAAMYESMHTGQEVALRYNPRACPLGAAGPTPLHGIGSVRP